MSTKAIEKAKGQAVTSAEGEPVSLLQLAVEKGVAVEILERLMDLQERVDARNARAAFFDALSAFQEETTEIPKSREAKIATRGGGEYSYTYAPLEAITRAIRPALRRHGLSYSWTTEPGAGILNVVCVLRHVDGHEERSGFPVPTATTAAMSEAQKNGAALTYGKRQSLTSVLGLTTADDDNDGSGARPGSLEPISDDELVDLESLMEEVHADRTRFLDHFNLGMLSQLTQKDYPRAIAMLEKKRKVGA